MNRSNKFNLPNISLRQISMCIAVVKTGSLRAASEEMGLTQGAISMGIKEAEKQLDCKLFFRNGRKLNLNESGRLLLPRMEELFRQANELKDILNISGKLMKGHLVVGASSTIGCYILPRIISNFQKQYPQLKIDLYVNNTSDILNDLSSGRLDLAFVEGTQTGRGLSIQPFMSDHLIVFCHPEHTLTLRKKLKWKDLTEETWLLREDGSGTHSIFMAHCLKEQVELHHTVHVGNTEAILRSVEAGIGIACLSKNAVQRSLDFGLLKELPVKPIHRQFYFAKNKHQHIGKVANLFLQEMEKDDAIRSQLSIPW